MHDAKEEIRIKLGRWLSIEFAADPAHELGFKMVTWIAAIEFVHDFHDLGAG
ncbi:hypothetical protein [Sphingomonas sp. LR55]|uniref:hypothetical protein n=1 Tax=Sphingomonas sp. LR55 TaxID=3050231 RepID=UPI002FE2B36B